MNPKIEEQLRIAIGAALIQSGWFDDPEPDEDELLEFHGCTDSCGRCPCSGVPYLSQRIWDKIDMFGNLSEAIRLIKEDDGSNSRG